LASGLLIWPAGRDREDFAKLDLAVGAGALAFDSNHIAGRHPVLLATGADNRVHTYASVKNASSRPSANRATKVFRACCFRVGALGNECGRPQNGTASTGKQHLFYRLTGKTVKRKVTMISLWPMEVSFLTPPETGLRNDAFFYF